MNFHAQFARILVFNPIAWLWWICAVAPLGNTLFGREFSFKAFLVFGSLTLLGLALAIALAKHAVRTRQYI